MRRAARKDANQGEIVTALRDAGYLVWILDEPCDLLVAKEYETHDVQPLARLWLLEVKDSAKPPSARKLTAKQVETHKRWPVIVVENVQQALQAVRGGV